MKHAIISTVFSLLFAGSALAAGDIHQEKLIPDDPCTVLFCMGGLLTGSQDQECQPSIHVFWSLKSYGRHGFDAWETFKKRRGKLDNCPSADSAVKSGVLDRFGRVEH